MIKVITQCFPIFPIKPFSALKGPPKITAPNINVCTGYMAQDKSLTPIESELKTVTFNNSVKCRTTTGTTYTQHGLNS
jgi:hypothetical protein